MDADEQTNASTTNVNTNNNLALANEVQIKVDQGDLNEYRELDKDNSVNGSEHGDQNIEIDSLKDVESDRVKEKRKERDGGRKDRANEVSNSRSRDKDRDRSKNGKDRERAKEKDKDKDKEKDKDKDKEKEKEKDKDTEKEKERRKDRDRDRSKNGKSNRDDEKETTSTSQRSGVRKNFSPDRRRNSSRDNNKRTRNRPYSPISKSPARRNTDTRYVPGGRGNMNDIIHRKRNNNYTTNNLKLQNRDRVRPVERTLGPRDGPSSYLSGQHDISRNQRRETERLAREQMKLQIERENFEREKALFLREERKRTMAERERLAREREELRKRQQQTSQYSTGISSKVDDPVRMIPSNLSIGGVKRDRDSRDMDSTYNTHNNWNNNNKYRVFNNQQAGTSHMKSHDEPMDYNSSRYRNRRF